MDSATRFMSQLGTGIPVLDEEYGYFRVLRTFQKSLSLITNLSLTTVTTEGEILADFSHPQDMLHSGIINDTEHLTIWLNKAGDDFCIIPCVGGMVFMCTPVFANGKQAGYVLAGPVWEAPPNREQRQELSKLLGWNEQQLREAIISHPATIPIDLSSGREVTISLAILTTELLQLHTSQLKNINTFRQLYDISARLGTSLNLNEIINIVIDGTLSLVKSLRCSLALIDENKDNVTITSKDVSPSESTKVYKIPLNGELKSYIDSSLKSCFNPESKQRQKLNSLKLPIYIAHNYRGHIEIIADDEKGEYDNIDIELLQIMANDASSAIERSLVYTQALHQFRELEALQSVSLSINSNSDTPKTLRQILDHTCNLLGAQTASVMLLEPDGKTLKICIAKGLSEEVVKQTRVHIGDRFSGQVALTGNPIIIRKSDGDNEHGSSLCVPLKVKDKIIGVLNVRGHAEDEQFSKDDLNLATRLANMSAAALEKAELHDELQQLFLESITALANSIDARDSYTRGHSERVADYSLLIGSYLNFTQSEMWRLRNAALLHDIGKIKIPDRLLNKPDKLTDEEFAEMKLHPVYGAGIMHSVKSFNSMVPFILHHHEKYDGTGYPDHKAGEEIPFYARIISVGDAFDAMTSTRPYRRCMNPDIALERLIKAKGTQLDPYLVNIFEILYKRGLVDPIVEKARNVEGTQDSRIRIHTTSPGVVFFSQEKLKQRKRTDRSLPTSLGTREQDPNFDGKDLAFSSTPREQAVRESGGTLEAPLSTRDQDNDIKDSDLPTSAGTREQDTHFANTLPTSETKKLKNQTDLDNIISKELEIS